MLEIVRLFAIAAVKRQQDLTLERRAISQYKKKIKTPLESTRAQGPKQRTKDIVTEQKSQLRKTHKNHGSYVTHE